MYMYVQMETILMTWMDWGGGGAKGHGPPTWKICKFTLNCMCLKMVVPQGRFSNFCFFVVVVACQHRGWPFEQTLPSWHNVKVQTNLGENVSESIPPPLPLSLQTNPVSAPEWHVSSHKTGCIHVHTHFVFCVNHNEIKLVGPMWDLLQMYIFPPPPPKKKKKKKKRRRKKKGGGGKKKQLWKEK